MVQSLLPDLTDAELLVEATRQSTLQLRLLKPVLPVIVVFVSGALAWIYGNRPILGLMAAAVGLVLLSGLWAVAYQRAQARRSDALAELRRRGVEAPAAAARPADTTDRAQIRRTAIPGTGMVVSVLAMVGSAALAVTGPRPMPPWLMASFGVATGTLLVSLAWLVVVERNREDRRR